MKNKISEKLILNLSLYLDGELPKEEMTEIEELLKLDPQVRKTFDSLKNTRVALRNAPQIKRRRSFILNPEKVKSVSKENRWVLGMRLVSSFSMILLLVVFTQSMFSGFKAQDLMSMAISENASNYDMAADNSGAPEMAFAIEEETVEDIQSKSATGDDLDSENSDDCAEVEVCTDSDVLTDDERSTEAVGRATVPEEIPMVDSDIPLDENGLSMEGVGGGQIPLDENIESTETVDGSMGNDEMMATPTLTIEEPTPMATEAVVEVEATQPVANAAMTEQVVEDANEPVANALSDGDPIEELNNENNLALIIVLSIVFGASSGTYIFLKKKFN